MEVAEEIYAQLHSPSGMPELGQAIEEALVRCRRRGVRYPRILLRRKIELAKGEYVPRLPHEASTPISAHQPRGIGAGPIPAELPCRECRQVFRSYREREAHACPMEKKA